MAAFSSQQQISFLVDPCYLSNAPFHQVEEIKNASCCFPYYFASESVTEASAIHESSTSVDSGRQAGAVESQMNNSAVLVEEKKVMKPQSSLEKKRKNTDGNCLGFSKTKDAKQSKIRKQKKVNGDLKDTEENKLKDGEVDDNKASEQASKGYIHVRARRGQATDSHSLAERVRREKISLRFKVLQDLVPGCDKVTGKALMLDEIINYVQSLQNQVEFLSMKLASVNPMLYDFAADFDDVWNQSEKMGTVTQPLPSVSQTSHTLPTGFEEAANNYPMMGVSRPILLQTHGPTAMSQDDNSSLVQVGDQRQAFLNQVVAFDNMCLFQ